MNDNPCYGCKKRHTRCHVDCAEYNAFRQKNAERNAQRAAEVRADNDYREAKKRTNRIAEHNE